MRHSASLTLTLPGDVVLREPTSWERVKRLFLPASMAPDLMTEERDLNRNVVSLTEGLCAVLREVDVTDAVYLAVDGRTVYYDALGIPNDAERLLEAAQSRAPSEPFRELRAVFMQRQEGLELLYEVTFQRRFAKDAPAAFLAVSGRLGALRPQAGESIAEAQARLHTVLGDGELAASLRAYFDELVDRLQQSLGRAFPEGSVARCATSTFVMRPSPHAVRELSRRGLIDPRPHLRARPVCYHQTQVMRPYYDPWDCYFDDGGLTWTDLVELRELLEGAWQPGLLSVDVVDSSGALLCQAGEASAHGELFGGVVELAAQDFTSSDLSSIQDRVSSCIAELPDAAPLLEVQNPLPDLFALTPTENNEFSGQALWGMFDFGREAASSVADAASSVGDAVSDFDWSD